MNNVIISIFLSITFLCTPLWSTQLLQGDSDAPDGVTFSFPIDQIFMSGLGTLFVGAGAPLENNKEFALSRLVRGSFSFAPIAPETVVLNGVVDKPNPLYGQEIIALSLLRPVGSTDTPLAVTASQPASICLAERIFDAKSIAVAQTPPAHDARGTESSGIVSMATNILAHVFAAVKPAAGNFGDIGSGIALFVRGIMSEMSVFQEVDAQTGHLVEHPKAIPLDLMSPLVTMNGAALAAMGQTAVLHWDESIKRLFIGLNVTSNTGSDDGALAVVVGELTEGGGLELYPIAPTAAFGPGVTTNIVGVLNSNNVSHQQVTINALNSMYTSTGINYLIVLGGISTNQLPSTQTVYALPLVNNGDAIGMLAQKDEIPNNVFSTGDVQRLTARTLSLPALDQLEMTQTTNVAARIGGGPLFAGAITQLVVRDDTVFALVGNNVVDPNRSGIYSSQALFDVTGKIKGWTTWQRAAGTTDAVFNGTLNIFDGTFIYATGSSAQTVNTLFETTWSDGNPQGLLPVTTFLNSIFSIPNGGIQNLQTFLPTSPGLTDIAVMTAGGIGTIALVQTGIVENGIIAPTPADDYTTIKQYTDGTITDLPDAKIITISGGALTTVGPITATTFASNDTFGWLFVGGSTGLALLSNPDGSGWNIAQNELGNTFDGLTPGMSFKAIGSYAFIKKLICDDTFLYVVAYDHIDRINLATSDFANNTLDVVTIATRATLEVVTPNGSILDAVISQACALVATTGGMVRVGDNQDVRTAHNASDAQWTPVIIPEKAGASTQLLCITPSGQDTDCTRGIGGQFYVLTSNEGYDQSRINRFVINPLSSTQPMQETTVQPFDDIFVENIPSFFLNFGNFNSIFATDGALYFASRCKNNIQPPRTVLTPAYPAPQVAARNVGERSTTVSINFNNGTEINGFQRSQASGSWVVAGDFGMQVLE